jgi:hypothetical protein
MLIASCAWLRRPPAAISRVDAVTSRGDLTYACATGAGKSPSAGKRHESSRRRSSSSLSPAPVCPEIFGYSSKGSGRSRPRTPPSSWGR